MHQLKVAATFDIDKKVDNKLVLLAICILCFSMPLPLFAASFPCEKADTDIERTICKDKELSELDEYLANYYAGARFELRYATECLKADQRAWLREVRDLCTTRECIKQAYLQRLSELDGLQPGASALKFIELPSTPALVGILPPAGDQIAAAPRSSLKPLSVQGKIINEVATGDGYVIVSKDGRKYLIVPLMFTDETTAVLESLSRYTANTYLIRGKALADTSGQGAFSESSCRYIYRMPQ